MDQIFDNFVLKKSSLVVQNTSALNTQYWIDKKKTLGSGAYGKVYRVQHKETGDIRACKIILKDDNGHKSHYMNEIYVLQALDHQNVLKIYEYFETEKKIYIITEMCSGGSLMNFICESDQLSEKIVAHIFKQIMQAISYCHKKGIAHRDIKPQNILITQGVDKELPEIRLIDFGFAKILKPNDKGTGLKRMKSMVGSQFYIAPEIEKKSYSETCDLWSAGCVLYIMLCGYVPKESNNQHATKRNN